jgi:hypothetical protein
MVETREGAERYQSKVREEEAGYQSRERAERYH